MAQAAGAGGAGQQGRSNGGLEHKGRRKGQEG